MKIAILTAAQLEMANILRPRRNRRLAYQCDAQRPIHAQTGGASASRYPAFTNFRKTNVKNNRPGAIQTSVNMAVRRLRGESARQARSGSIAAQPKQRK